MHGRLPESPNPPISNIQAEATVLGGLMLENRLIDRAADILKPGDFAEPFFARVYTAMLREHEAGRSANPITLLPYFEADPALADLGGRGFLADLAGSLAGIVGALDCAGQVAELAARRRFAESLVLIARGAEDAETDLVTLADETETALAAALHRVDAGTGLAASVFMGRVLEAMTDDGPGGVTCGIMPTLDRVLGPIRPGWSVILAGRPGQGKTATAISYAHGAAENGHGVLIVSLEMRGEDLAGRLACDVAYSLGRPVPYAKITGGGATPDERRQIARATLLAKEWPLFIEDLPSATIGRVASAVRRCARRFKARGQALELVIVDYLQLVRPNEREKDLYQAISAVSRGLKEIAKAEGVGVMALCQLSRSVEAREDKRPRTDDLRDSGQIEQDADSICFLLRREEYLQREQPHENGPKWDSWREAIDAERGRIEFIVPKRRFGRAGSGFGQWLGEFQAVRG